MHDPRGALAVRPAACFVPLNGGGAGGSVSRTELSFIHQHILGFAPGLCQMDLVAGRACGVCKGKPCLTL